MKNQVWFVVISDDKRGPFSEEEIATLLKAGSLSERSLVWSKDALTDDWLPIFRSDLKHLVSGAEISPPALPPIEREINTKPATLLEQPTLVRADQSGSYSGPELTDWGSPNTTEIGQGSKRLETETSNGTLTNVLLGLTAFLAIFQLVSFRNYLKGSKDVQSRYDRYIDLQNEPLTIAVGVLAIAWLVLFLWWMRNETKNLIARRGQQSITPAGAVYWFFVPVFNLWKPIEAMTNIVKGKVQDKLDKVVIMVFAWWISTILSLLSYVISGSILNSGQQLTVASAEQGLRWDLIANLLDLVSIALIYAVIDAVKKASTARHP